MEKVIVMHVYPSSWRKLLPVEYPDILYKFNFLLLLISLLERELPDLHACFGDAFVRDGLTKQPNFSTQVTLPFCDSDTLAL